MARRVGALAQQKYGFWRTHGLLMARRLVQASVICAFWLGPWTGYWLLRGNLSGSLLLDTVPMTDLFLFLQSLAAGHWPETNFVLGAVVVLSVYALLGGRVFCGWVCPVNAVTDAARWLRQRLGIRSHWRVSRTARHWLFWACLLSALLSGQMVWEYWNPVSMWQRALTAGTLSGVSFVTLVFLLDLAAGQGTWCGHLCPHGQAYAAVGVLPLGYYVRASRRQHCDDCMDCYQVCPEAQLLKQALKGEHARIESAQCTRCARCAEICHQRVFQLEYRFLSH
ncbi:MAG: quinol dehydrogenase ferredoxin subunit NapH [Gammaproteobacteria bacterium]|nr:MAG: quinol dehydrogenase ferredoxin subunit NapH [Gammaproteobacteria bacterium]